MSFTTLPQPRLCAPFSVEVTDPDNTQLSYTWNFGDDSNQVQGPTVQHIFTNPGTYPVTVTITNDQGTSVTENLTVSVNPIMPGTFVVDQTGQVAINILADSGAYQGFR